jgi:hypothetical protein
MPCVRWRRSRSPSCDDGNRGLWGMRTYRGRASRSCVPVVRQTPSRAPRAACFWLPRASWSSRPSLHPPSLPREDRALSVMRDVIQRRRKACRQRVDHDPRAPSPILNREDDVFSVRKRLSQMGKVSPAAESTVVNDWGTAPGVGATRMMGPFGVGAFR